MIMQLTNQFPKNSPKKLPIRDPMRPRINRIPKGIAMTFTFFLYAASEIPNEQSATNNLAPSGRGYLK
jgi:hypothetical protein